MITNAHREAVNTRISSSEMVEPIRQLVSLGPLPCCPVVHLMPSGQEFGDSSKGVVVALHPVQPADRRHAERTLVGNASQNGTWVMSAQA